MYTAIYRDFRPDNFDRLIGQDHIVRILKNQIASEQTGHAYLFCGTRGTGKTTTARILAKALNCESEGEKPCGVCDNCISIKDGTFMDVIEIDAASNNGVDNIRELRESVKYPPVKGRNKVYIIDEVHMLSSGAFNALLKTLEEPPENVVFILATTEPHKLPATILSRCMRLDFRRVSEKTIIENMKMICAAKGISAEEGALALIAANADGSVRDSLSILEQCISTGQDTVLRDDAAELLGNAGEEVMIAITDFIMKSDVAGALLLLDSAVNSGIDIKQFMREWLSHFRNLLMAKYIENVENALNMSLENAGRVKAQAERISTELLDRGITELTKTISETKWSSQQRVMLEMCIVRLGAGRLQETPVVFNDKSVNADSAGNIKTEKSAPGAAYMKNTAGIIAESHEAENAGIGAGDYKISGQGININDHVQNTAKHNSAENPAFREYTDFEINNIPDKEYENIYGEAELFIPKGSEPVISGQLGYDDRDGYLRSLAADFSLESEFFEEGGFEAEQRSRSAAKKQAVREPGAAGQEQNSQQNLAELKELWRNVVKKAIGEKPMLLRIETKARLVRIDDKNFYVCADDDITERMLLEKGRDILEKNMEMYHGSRLSLCLEKAAPQTYEPDSGAEELAKRISDRFNIKVEVK
ncbi:MAG: DNA polymerase III subunit gamma/tau [Firmicutes bacterium]|nr:DNA polymerase III subunit gamma/tau [Bacillota bacterium]